MRIKYAAMGIILSLSLNTHPIYAQQGDSLQEDIEIIKIVSVGDIMMHEEQIKSGYDHKTKKYDYNYMFEPIQNYLQSGDLAIGNLELTLAGQEKKYTGYPRFNAPDQLAYALKAAGFNILTTANNHSLDRNFQGVKRTIEVLDKVGTAHTGTFSTLEESKQILIKEVKETKIAFLAYTYGTNGIRFDKGSEFSVNLISKNKISSDIAKAKELEAEVICVSIHFGDEYIRIPNSKQKEMVNFLVGEGADIILGSHPHVVQPLEIRNITRNGVERQVAILYSQGNFISTQRDRYKDSGALFNIEIEKNKNTQAINIKSVAYIPTWIDLSRIGGAYHFRILPAKKYIHIYEGKRDALISAMDYTKLKRSLKDIRDILQTADQRIYEQLTFINE